jgi:metal-responsive CopG/Arc/MetJ family transcriptional regulator
MKTAISLPDPIFKAGERHASRFRLSRSQLYASALKEYLARHSDEAVTETLNRVYSAEHSKLDPALRALQLRTLAAEKWK